LNNAIDRLIAMWFDNGVHMIWHDAPGEQPIALAIEVKQRCLNNLCDVRPTQPASPQSSVELVIGLGQIVRKFSQRLSYRLG